MRKRVKFFEQFGGNISIGVACLRLVLPILMLFGFAASCFANPIVTNTRKFQAATAYHTQMQGRARGVAYVLSALGLMGMAVKNSHNPTEEVLFQAFNTPRYHEFICSPGELLTGFDVMLVGSAVVSGGTTNGTSHGPNPGGLIQKFEVFAKTASGSPYSGGTLKALVPASVLGMAVYDRGVDQAQTAIDGSIATKTIAQRFSFHFANPSQVRPIESALRLDQFSFLQLKITNAGSPAAMLVGNDRTWDVSALKYRIIEHRAYNPSYFPPFQLWEDDVDLQITAANKRFFVKDQISQSEAYMFLLLQSYSNSDLADTIFNYFSLYSNGEKFVDHIDATDVRDLNRDFSKDAANVLTGKYAFPVGEGLLTSAVGGLSMEIDLNHPGTDDFLITSRRVTMVKLPTAK